MFPWENGAFPCSPWISNSGKLPGWREDDDSPSQEVDDSLTSHLSLPPPSLPRSPGHTFIRGSYKVPTNFILTFPLLLPLWKHLHLRAPQINSSSSEISLPKPGKVPSQQAGDFLSPKAAIAAWAGSSICEKPPRSQHRQFRCAGSAGPAFPCLGMIIPQWETKPWEL